MGLPDEWSNFHSGRTRFVAARSVRSFAAGRLNSGVRCLMKFSRWMRLVSASFALAAIALLSIGVSTLYWPTTNAMVETSRSERITLHGYNVRRSAINRTDLDIKIARYTYSVKGVTFQSSQICFCLPLGTKNLVPIGGDSTVSYLAADPRWSVLAPGPDIFTALVLLGVSLLIYLGEESLLKLLGIDA